MGARSLRNAGVRGALIAFCLALACWCAWGVSVAYADEAIESTNEVGTSFSVDYTNEADGVSGTITYKITKASADGEMGEVELMNGRSYAAQESSPALVIDTVESGGYTYAVTALKYECFKVNSNLYHVIFARDLPDVSDFKTGTLPSQQKAVGYKAFSSCENLASVEFKGSYVNGIGDMAFSNCSSLSSVVFAEGLTLTSIGDSAFSACALTSFKVPALTGATRTPNYYSTFGFDESALLEDRDVSGYMGCWHDKLYNFAIASRGISALAFQMNPLESIVFEAGSETGLFAYWNSEGAGLRYDSSLKSVVYESTQPYYGNPNSSMNNGAYKTTWGLTGSEATDDDGNPIVTAADPDFYYAVDFYTTQEEADQADSYGSTRSARVEYVRDTPVDLIQAGPSDELAEYELDTPALYASTAVDDEGNAKYADGATPDPQAAALAAQEAGVEGFEDADQHSWIWMLDDTQSRRAGLSDSCKAYLVTNDDISASHIEANVDGANQIAVLYKLCDQNISQGSIQNTAFDYKRYYDYVARVAGEAYRNPDSTSANNTYVFDEATINSHIGTGTVNFKAGETPWFTLDSAGLKSLISQMTMYDGAGLEIDLGDVTKFSITFYQYQTDTNTLEEVLLGEAGDGPLLMTVQPLEGSGYDTSTEFQEWILVYDQQGSLIERYSDSVADTWYKAVRSNGDGYTETESFDIENGYEVGISSGDSLMALAAVSYAGLVQGGITTVSEDASYGMSLALPGNYYSTGFIIEEDDCMSFPRDDKSISDFVAAVYTAFNKNKTRWGVSSKYEWGTTAVLVNPTYAADVATATGSYAYANAAPIFYTESDGTLGDATATCLADFDAVMIFGDEKMVPEDTLTAVEKATGKSDNVTRISGTEIAGTKDSQEVGNACSLSLAVADQLTQGDDATNSLSKVSIVIAEDSDVVVDSVSALNFSGHESGVTLVVAGSADAKRVAQYLRTHRDEVSRIRIFGRGDAVANTSTFTFIDALGDTWDTAAEAIPVVTTTDTIELYGVKFYSDANRILTALSGSPRIWGVASIEKGTYVYGVDENGDPVEYKLKQSIAAPTTSIDKPEAATGLTYSGAAQVGVAAGVGYSVTNGSATDAGTYTATVKLEDNYEWSDGTTDDLSIEWKIAPVALTGATVELATTSMTYTGAALQPTVSAVKLADGTTLPSTNYSVSYSNNVEVGTGTVTVTGKGNYTGTLTATFAIVAADPTPTPDPTPDPSDDDDSDDDGETDGSSTSAGTVSTKTTTTTKTTVVSDDDDDDDDLLSAVSGTGVASTVRTYTVENGWRVFAAPGVSEAEVVAAANAEISPLAVGSIAICCLAFCAALLYVKRFKRETDDQLVTDEPKDDNVA